MKKMKIKNEAEDRGRISRVLDFRSKLFHTNELKSVRIMPLHLYIDQI